MDHVESSIRVVCEGMVLMEISKVIVCQGCSGRIEVSGEVDETDGPDETDQKATCPTCGELNRVLWPTSPSGWVVFAVRIVAGNEDGP